MSDYIKCPWCDNFDVTGEMVDGVARYRCSVCNPLRAFFTLMPAAYVSPGAIVGRILSCLNTRKGFDDWWDNIDDGIREEIFAELTLVAGKDVPVDLAKIGAEFLAKVDEINAHLGSIASSVSPYDEDGRPK